MYKTLEMVYNGSTPRVVAGPQPQEIRMSATATATSFEDQLAIAYCEANVANSIARLCQAKTVDEKFRREALEKLRAALDVLMHR